MLRRLLCIDINSSSDEDYKTEERRKFKKDFLGMLEARIFEVQENGRAVILVSQILSVLCPSVFIDMIGVFHRGDRLLQDTIPMLVIP